MLCIIVGRILDPALLEGRERRAQPSAGDRDERAKEAVPRPFAERRHGREAVDPAPAREPQKEGLGLVLALVCHEKVKHAVLPAPVLEQAITRLAGRGLEIGARLLTAPGERLVRDPVCGEPALDASRFRRRLWPQPMIDGQSHERSAVLFGPVAREDGERHAVGSPRDRNRDARLGLEWSEAAHEARELSRAERCRRCRSAPAHRAQPQPARWRSRCTACFTFVGAAG